MKFKEIFEADGRQRSKAYQFTYDPRNGEDSLKMDQFKQKVSDHNKANPTDQYKLRRWGRLGDDNASSAEYKKGGSLYKRSYAGPQYVHPEHASRFDVYVHPHSNEPYSWPPKERVHWKDREENK